MEQKNIVEKRDIIELSYLDNESQRDLVDFIDDTDVFPSFSQTVRMRKAFNNGELIYELIAEIMAEDKANQKPRYRFSVEKLNPYLPSNLNDKQEEDCVLKTLSHYKKYIERKNLKRKHMSNLVICYVEYDYGGAYKTVEYAKKKGKVIIDRA